MSDIRNVELIDKLNKDKSLSKDEWVALLGTYTASDKEYARGIARRIALENFGKKVFFRGIVEFTNYCKNDCKYCGIRHSNNNASRYRLTAEEILECCREGYENGYRTFVLQGGEDAFYADDIMCQIVRNIKEEFPGCAVTLSLGERSEESYRKLYDAGTDRYLLRHETANKAHYEKLHPSYQKFENRMKCLDTLKRIGYQTGCGCMIGSPFQTVETLAEDMIYMGKFDPQMIGIGPFIPHSDTEFKDFSAGNVELTLFVLSLCRIMLPSVLLPATTALGTVSSDGRKNGVLAGCNVVMPNLSPLSQRKKYQLYNRKIDMKDTVSAGVDNLKKQMSEIGYEVVFERGDYRRF